MNQKTVSNICKYVSALLAALVIVMLFRGFLTIADRDDKKDAIKGVKSALSDFKRLDEDDIEDFQDELDDYDIDLNAKRLISQVKGFLTILKDGEVSPYEIAVNTPSVISLANEMEEYDELAYFMDYDDIIYEMENVKGGLIALMILFVVTVIVGVLVVIMHVSGKKMAGILLTVLSFVWFVITCVAAYKINDFAEYELDYDDKFVKITGAPVWALIFAVLAMLIWIYRDKITGFFAGSGAATQMQAYGAAIGQNTGIKCPNCGQMLNAGAVFCTNCGERFDSQAASAAPATPATPAQAATPVAPAAGKVCPNCQAVLSDDSEFCTNCGTKIV
ncbi:MAG: zinc ribbon domain-containing protein [Lachnospiraceae bacterium]|nr:zinc ribbon domain-containing protein [Lachnospiraceae bacterium]